MVSVEWADEWMEKWTKREEVRMGDLWELEHWWRVGGQRKLRVCSGSGERRPRREQCQGNKTWARRRRSDLLLFQMPHAFHSSATTHAVAFAKNSLHPQTNHPFKPSLHLILLEAFLSCPEVGNDPITFCLYFFLQVPSYLAVMYQLLSFSVDDGELFYGNQWSLNHYIHP